MKEALKAMLALLLAGVFSVTIAVVAMQRPAHADPKPGLWQEQVTTADGVTIRKIRDTTGGDFNVCYVASRETNYLPSSVAVAISCLPEKKP